jgi:hypothetical protein
MRSQIVLVPFPAFIAHHEAEQHQNQWHLHSQTAHYMLRRYAARVPLQLIAVNSHTRQASDIPAGWRFGAGTIWLPGKYCGIWQLVAQMSKAEQP